MFTLSAKAIYGLTAVVELAHQYRSGPVQIRDIASRHEIPRHYLEQILNTLKRSELVRSHRGAHGGYELTAHPDSISLRAVLTELEGPLAVAHVGPAASLQPLWDDLAAHIDGFLAQSLDDVMRRRITGQVDQDFII
tara:strand:+ start:225 stop:635 length:411 start_codon:yes stop_codon:yes gene_type:complete